MRTLLLTLLLALPCLGQITGPATVGYGELITLSVDGGGSWLPIEPVDLRYAVEDAGLTITGKSRNIGAVIASGGGGHGVYEQHLETMLSRGPDRVSPLAVASAITLMRSPLPTSSSGARRATFRSAFTAPPGQASPLSRATSPAASASKFSRSGHRTSSVPSSANPNATSRMHSRKPVKP